MVDSIERCIRPFDWQGGKAVHHCDDPPVFVFRQEIIIVEFPLDADGIDWTDGAIGGAEPIDDVEGGKG